MVAWNNVGGVEAARNEIKYILKVEPREFCDSLDAGYKRKRGSKSDLMALRLIHCKVRKRADGTNFKGSIEMQSHVCKFEMLIGP